MIRYILIFFIICLLPLLPSMSMARSQGELVKRPIALMQGDSVLEIDYSFLNGNKIFDDEREVQDAGIFDFYESRVFFSYSYGLSENLTIKAGIPYLTRHFDYPIATSVYFDSEGNFVGANYMGANYNRMKNQGLGDLYLEATYQLFISEEPMTCVGIKLTGKIAIASSDFDEDEMNLGGGQSDFGLGLILKKQLRRFAILFHPGLRIRWKGDAGYLGDYELDPGDEGYAKLGLLFQAKEFLAFGLNADYIVYNKTKIEGSTAFITKPTSGFFLSAAPWITFQLNDILDITASVEIPIEGKNYPRRYADYFQLMGNRFNFGVRYMF